MPNHSPEPWTVQERDEGEGWYEIDHACNGGLDCRLSKEDAERIVACVNACVGLSDALVKAGPLKPLIRALEDTPAHRLMDEMFCRSGPPFQPICE
jgi:hypothetical protein